jgi:hypothetical protein
MRVLTLNLDQEMISLTLAPTTGKTSMDLSFPLNPELEQAILKQALSNIKLLMEEKSEITAGQANLSKVLN